MYLSTTLCLNELAKEANQLMHEKGFWPNDVNNAEKIALMHSELSEALEVLRQHKPFEVRDINCPQCLAIEIELADVIYRVLDFCNEYNLQIGEAFLAKHEYNKTRLHKHGKNF